MHEVDHEKLLAKETPAELDRFLGSTMFTPANAQLQAQLEAAVASMHAHRCAQCRGAFFLGVRVLGVRL